MNKKELIKYAIKSHLASGNYFNNVGLKKAGYLTLEDIKSTLNWNRIGIIAALSALFGGTLIPGTAKFVDPETNEIKTKFRNPSPGERIANAIGSGVLGLTGSGLYELISNAEKLQALSKINETLPILSPAAREIL